MDMENTDELTALREKLRSQRPVAWDQLPDFPLYMDQVLSYMERQVFRFEEGDGLTAAMVNNYTKSGLVPRAEGKKYNREHLAYLIDYLSADLREKPLGRAKKTQSDSLPTFMKTAKNRERIVKLLKKLQEG